MEALSTYTTLQEIADRAAGGYEKEVDGEPERYAFQVVKLYRSDDAPEPIKSNVYFRHLLECYPGTIRNEVVKIIERRQLGG